MSNHSLAAPEETLSAIHVRELRRGIAVSTAAKVLYAWARELWPDHPDYPLSFYAAPLFVQTRMVRLAAHALGTVNEAAEREAERLAELSLDSTLNETERETFRKYDTYSHLNVIEEAFRENRAFLQREKPIKAVLSVYRQVLERGGQ